MLRLYVSSQHDGVVAAIDVTKDILAVFFVLFF